MKNIIFAISILALLLVAGCTTEKPIGGERDEHGCLGAAGYTWDEDVGACTRSWELNEDHKAAAQIAVAPLSYPVTVVEVLVARCPGCFTVKLQRNDNNNELTVNINNWEIVTKPQEEITNFKECIDAGNPVMEGYPRQCSANGKTFVEEIAHTCTEEEKKAEICTMEYAPVCGDNGETYGNKCSACASGEIEYWIQGECEPTESLTIEKALDIAEQSECLQEGQLTDEYFYNEYIKTWWINLNTEKEGCNPACVVYETTKTAEINWRCTGLIPP